jgi:hypothetical protein
MAEKTKKTPKPKKVVEPTIKQLFDFLAAEDMALFPGGGGKLMLFKGNEVSDDIYKEGRTPGTMSGEKLQRVLEFFGATAKNIIEIGEMTIIMGSQAYPDTNIALLGITLQLDLEAG